MQQIKGRSQLNAEGYMNVASQLGLSGERGKFFLPVLLLKDNS